MWLVADGEWDLRAYKFVLSDGPWALFDGYTASLDNLARRAWEDITTLQTSVLALLVVEAAFVQLACVVYEWWLVRAAETGRRGGMLVGLGLPGPILRLLANKPLVVVEDSDDEDGDDEDGDGAPDGPPSPPRWRPPAPSPPLQVAYIVLVGLVNQQFGNVSAVHRMALAADRAQVVTTKAAQAEFCTRPGIAPVSVCEIPLAHTVADIRSALEDLETYHQGIYLGFGSTPTQQSDPYLRYLWTQPTQSYKFYLDSAPPRWANLTAGVARNGGDAAVGASGGASTDGRGGGGGAAPGRQSLDYPDAGPVSTTRAGARRSLDMPDAPYAHHGHHGQHGGNGHNARSSMDYLPYGAPPGAAGNHRSSADGGRQQQAAGGGGAGGAPDGVYSAVAALEHMSTEDDGDDDADERPAAVTDLVPGAAAVAAGGGGVVIAGKRGASVKREGRGGLRINGKLLSPSPNNVLKFMVPLGLWEIALVVVLTISFLRLDGIQGPLASLNMASRVIYRYTRVRMTALLLVASDSPQERAAWRGTLSTEINNLESEYDTLMYGGVATTQLGSAFTRPVPASTFESASFAYNFFKEERCFRWDQSHCYTPDSPYYEVTHHGLDAMMRRIMAEMALLVADDDADAVYNGTRYTTMYMVGVKDLYEGLQSSAQLFVDYMMSSSNMGSASGGGGVGGGGMGRIASMRGKV
ncbi:hypothetical protein GPECTOR_53g167 [Gonium pectorale]|uniref:Uncharacterized protein n=1 Tax=Gonium pectorale TaxID=33097 RepID=A0A150G6X6_GONPE|nr:hypothetical protein GPECTOR_53g167 [Gonium pectorale]|eukprot:KXZ45581.1 hypothetical protein GPECTOR_53g167 [Gonium pectorale]